KARPRNGRGNPPRRRAGNQEEAGDAAPGTGQAARQEVARRRGPGEGRRRKGECELEKVRADLPRTETASPVQDLEARIEAAERTLWALQDALQAEDVPLSGNCSTSLWSAWSCTGPTRRGGLRLPGSIGAWYDPERLQSQHCCLHRQTDDVADGSRPH